MKHFLHLSFLKKISFLLFLVIISLQYCTFEQEEKTVTVSGNVQLHSSNPIKVGMLDVQKEDWVEVLSFSQNSPYQFKMAANKDYVLVVQSENSSCTLEKDVFPKLNKNITDANIVCKALPTLSYNHSTTATRIYRYENEGKIKINLQNVGSNTMVYAVFTNTDSQDHLHPDAGSAYKSIRPNWTTTKHPLLPSSFLTKVSSASLHNSFSLENQTTATPSFSLNQPSSASFNREPPAFVREFEKELPQLLNKQKQSTQKNILYQRNTLPVFSYGTVNTTSRNWFTSDNTTEKAHTVLRAQGKVSNKIIKVWVENSFWGSGNEKINATKLLPLFQKFCGEGATNLFAGGTASSPGTCSGNSIYQKVVDIVGEPWGSHRYNNLIASNSNEIHIVLNKMPEMGNGYIGGFFFSANNVKRSSVAYSNEGLVFFLNAKIFGTQEGNSWEITDPHPQYMLSTLAHEFQHMIHFYQKNIVRNISSPVWLNEMASMVVEDLLAVFISGVGSGPAFGDPSRLYSHFNYPLCDLTKWYETPQGKCNIHSSYGQAFSFGAFVARHKGGAQFIKKLVASDKNHFEAINDAVGEANNPNAYKTWLARWGASIVARNKSIQSSAQSFPENANTTVNYGFVQQGNSCQNANDAPCLQKVTLTDTNKYPLVGINGATGEKMPAFVYPHSQMISTVAANYNGEIKIPAKTILTIVIDEE